MKRHLNPGGVVTQWVLLYESTPDVVKSEVATFVGSFPDATVWGNTNNGQGYDTVLRLQYLAGMGNNSCEGGPIYSEMLSYRRFRKRSSPHPSRPTQ